MRMIYVQETFFHLEKFDNDLAFCAKVKGNPEMIGKLTCAIGNKKRGRAAL